MIRSTWTLRLSHKTAHLSSAVLSGSHTAIHFEFWFAFCHSSKSSSLCDAMKWEDPETDQEDLHDNVMDPPLRRHGPIQRQDASVSDLPLPLRVDLHGKYTSEDNDDVPENDEAHLYEYTLSGLRAPAEPDHLPAEGRGDSEDPEHHYTNGPLLVPARAPPVPPRTRLPSACLPGQPACKAPPVPPRARIPRCNMHTQFSFGPTEHPHKLNRSRTEIDNHVSMWDRNLF